MTKKTMTTAPIKWVCAIDPGLASLGAAILRIQGIYIDVVRTVTIHTSPTQGMLDRAYTLVRGVSEIVSHCMFRYGAENFHIAYEEFYGGRSAMVGWQRGYVDHAFHQHILQSHAAALDEVTKSWWEIHPSVHLKWFHPRGRAIKEKGSDGRKLTKAEETIRHMKVLNIKPDDPLIKNVKRGDREHVLDAIAIGKALAYSICMDFDTGTPKCDLKPHQIKIVKSLQDKYPGLAEIARQHTLELR